MNIQPDNLIALVVSSFGILFCLSVGIHMFRRTKGVKQTNILLGLLLVLYSLTLLNSLLAMTGVFARYQNLYFIPLVFTLSIGPLFYLFVRSRIEPGYRLSRKDLLHFVLPGIQFFFYLVVSVQSQEAKSLIWRNLIYPYVQYVEEVLVIASGLGYLIYSITLIRKQIPGSNLNKSVHKWLRRFAFSLLVLLLLSSIYEIADWILWGAFEYNLFNTPWLDFPLKMAYAFLSLVIGYNAYIYQNQSLITAPVYPKSEGNKLKGHIDQLLQEEKVFLDPDLNLETFAKMLNTPRNTISKYFSASGQSFRSAINACRVAHFINRVERKEHHQMSLLGLALESGFNSKASFNRIFKEQQGQTPSSFIRSLAD